MMKEFKTMKELRAFYELRKVYVKKTPELKELEALIRAEQPTGRGTIYAMNVNDAISNDERFIKIARPMMLEKLHEHGLELDKRYEESPDDDAMGACKILDVVRGYKNSTKFEVKLEVFMYDDSSIRTYDIDTIKTRCIIK